jgi:hypothetical protein
MKRMRLLYLIIAIYRQRVVLKRRSSGRLPKRSRRDDDFVYEKP